MLKELKKSLLLRVFQRIADLSVGSRRKLKRPQPLVQQLVFFGEASNAGMGLDGAFGDGELFGDFPVAQALEFEDLQFARNNAEGLAFARVWEEWFAAGDGDDFD